MQFRAAKKFTHQRRSHFDHCGPAISDAASSLPGDLADLALQLTHACLTGVTLHQFEQRRAREGDLFRGKPILLDLARHQIALGDGHFLGFDVARELHHFHPVEQRTGDVLDEVRRRDEQHFAEIERNAEVVIGERVVLCRVEHFEQRRCWIALEGDPELVHFVEEEDRVARPGLLHPLDDAARHRPDIGPPVATDIGLVPRATKRDPDVLPPHRAGDTLGHRGLADTGRADEEQDRRSLAGLLGVGSNSLDRRLAG